MRFATATVALVASASSALAVGNAVIVNHCSYDVIVTSVSNTAGNPQTVKANGGQYSEQYRENPNGGGISLKVSQDGDSGPVCQFEYTYNPPTNPYPGVFWDLSLINGNIFADTAVALIPTIHSGNPGGSCYDVNCPGGQQCKDAYNSPFENAATHSCPADTDLTYYLCSDGKSQPAASPSPSPKPSPSPQPSPSPKPSPAAPAPAPVELKVETSPTPTPTPAPAAKSPTAFVLGYKEAGGPVIEIAAQKREAGHANHLERHRRIRRMHHARTVE